MIRPGSAYPIQTYEPGARYDVRLYGSASISPEKKEILEEQHETLKVLFERYKRPDGCYDLTEFVNNNQINKHLTISVPKEKSLENLKEEDLKSVQFKNNQSCAYSRESQIDLMYELVKPRDRIGERGTLEHYTLLGETVKASIFTAEQISKVAPKIIESMNGLWPDELTKSTNLLSDLDGPVFDSLKEAANKLPNLAEAFEKVDLSAAVSGLGEDLSAASQVISKIPVPSAVIDSAYHVFDFAGDGLNELGYLGAGFHNTLVTLESAGPVFSGIDTTSLGQGFSAIAGAASGVQNVNICSAIASTLEPFFELAGNFGDGCPLIAIGVVVGGVGAYVMSRAAYTVPVLATSLWQFYDEKQLDNKISQMIQGKTDMDMGDEINALTTDNVQELLQTYQPTNTYYLNSFASRALRNGFKKHPAFLYRSLMASNKLTNSKQYLVFNSSRQLLDNVFLADKDQFTITMKKMADDPNLLVVNDNGDVGSYWKVDGKFEEDSFFSVDEYMVLKNRAKTLKSAWFGGYTYYKDTAKAFLKQKTLFDKLAGSEKFNILDPELKKQFIEGLKSDTNLKDNFDKLNLS